MIPARAMPPTRDDGLVDAHAHSRTPVYLADLWNRRSYVWYVAVSEVRSRQIHTVLGSLWYLLNPILSIAVYFFIFGVVLGTDRGLDGVGEFLLFLTVGLFVFQYTQRAVMKGGSSIVSNQGLVRAIRFPRALLPTSSTITELIASLPAFAVIFVVAVGAGQMPRWQWLIAVPMIAWQSVLNLGGAFAAARLTVHFRDTQQALPFMFRLLFYGSGVLFSVDAYVSDPQLRLVFVLNPLYGLISIWRWLVMGRPVDGDVVLASAVWTIVALIAGFFWFRAAEHSYDRV